MLQGVSGTAEWKIDSGRPGRSHCESTDHNLSHSPGGHPLLSKFARRAYHMLVCICQGGVASPYACAHAQNFCSSRRCAVSSEERWRCREIPRCGPTSSEALSHRAPWETRLEHGQTRRICATCGMRLVTGGPVAGPTAARNSPMALSPPARLTAAHAPAPTSPPTISPSHVPCKSFAVPSPSSHATARGQGLTAPGTWGAGATLAVTRSTSGRSDSNRRLIYRWLTLSPPLTTTTQQPTQPTQPTHTPHTPPWLPLNK